MSREWRFFLTDMIEFCGQIEIYVEGLDYQEFIDSTLKYDATVHKVELLGEAARKIPEDVQQLAPNIDWPKLRVATRARRIRVRSLANSTAIETGESIRAIEEKINRPHSARTRVTLA